MPYSSNTPGPQGPQGIPGLNGLAGNPFGVFTSNAVQAPTAANTEFLWEYDSSATNGLHYDPVNRSRIVADVAGVYNLQFSAQVYNSDGGGSSVHAEIWLKKNGNNYPNSASRVSVTPNSPYVIPAWNFVFSLEAGEYVELAWSVSHVGVQLLAAPVNTIVPAIPSLIVTMTKVSE